MLTDTERTELFDALLGDVGKIPEGHEARKALERVALDDLTAIEPIIERLINTDRAKIAAALLLLNRHLSGRTYTDLDDALRNMLQAYVTLKGLQKEKINGN